MLKYLLTFMAFTAPGFAQSFDLRGLPADYSFISQGSDVRVTIRFIRREESRFLFEESTLYNDGASETVDLWLNAQSQTISYGVTGAETRFSPHDCAPTRGACLYTWFSSEDSFEMKSVTKLVGDIWLADTYFKDGDTWEFWVRDCTTYDEFGFWMDFIRIYNDDETQTGARVRPAPDRLDELWQVCQPPQLTS